MNTMRTSRSFGNLDDWIRRVSPKTKSSLRRSVIITLVLIILMSTSIIVTLFTSLKFLPVDDRSTDFIIPPANDVIAITRLRRDTPADIIITTTEKPPERISWEDQQRLNFAGPWSFWWMTGIFLFNLIIMFTCYVMGKIRDNLKNQTR